VVPFSYAYAPQWWYFGLSWHFQLSEGWKE